MQTLEEPYLSYLITSLRIYFASDEFYLTSHLIGVHVVFCSSPANYYNMFLLSWLELIVLAECCFSKSDTFADTESLAMHAFTSTKVGLRTQHLGLHKALCVLMGWKSAEDFNSQWLSEVMSDAETSSIKEDLIIWPPLVIIHNSTIGKKYPDEQVILSTEALESKLKGKFLYLEWSRFFNVFAHLFFQLKLYTICDFHFSPTSLNLNIKMNFLVSCSWTASGQFCGSVQLYNRMCLHKCWLLLPTQDDSRVSYLLNFYILLPC